jgi:ketosteroid isomerase-like protein
MTEENVRIARSAYDAFARADLAAVLETFHPDVEWHAAEGLPWGGVHKGRDEVAQNVFGALLGAFEGFTLTHERFIDGGDYVVALGRYSATARRSGNSLDAAFAHVWELEDGQLRRYYHYTDTLKFQAALSGGEVRAGDRPTH